MNEQYVEETIKKKVVTPPPPGEELLSMLDRFRPYETKERMIEKFNSPNCGPSWTPYQKRVAIKAISMLLTGTAPERPKRRNENAELESEIFMNMEAAKPKSEIEIRLENELRKMKQKLDAVMEKIAAPSPSPSDLAASKEAAKDEDQAKTQAVDITEEVDTLPISGISVKERKKGRPKQELIPEKLKK